MRTIWAICPNSVLVEAMCTHQARTRNPGHFTVSLCFVFVCVYVSTCGFKRYECSSIYIYMAYVSCQRLTEQLVRFIVLISYRTISITMSKRTCNTPLTRPWLLGSVNESRAITTAISQNLLTQRSGNAIYRCGRCSQSCASVANARRHRRSCVQCV